MPTSGNTFFVDGSEQWALAAYLTNIQVYSQADTAAAGDLRIQNLSLRTDTVAWPRILRVAMDACHYERNTNGAPFTGGYFDAARWAWITNQLASALARGKFVIGIVHHGVMEHYAGQKSLFPE